MMRKDGWVGNQLVYLCRRRAAEALPCQEKRTRFTPSGFWFSSFRQHALNKDRCFDYLVRYSHVCCLSA